MTTTKLWRRLPAWPPPTPLTGLTARLLLVWPEVALQLQVVAL